MSFLFFSETHCIFSTWKSTHTTSHNSHPKIRYRNVAFIFRKRSVFQCLPTIIIPLASLLLFFLIFLICVDGIMVHWLRCYPTRTLLNLMLKGLPIKHFAVVFLYFLFFFVQLVSFCKCCVFVHRDNSKKLVLRCEIKKKSDVHCLLCHLWWNDTWPTWKKWGWNIHGYQSFLKL